jgi:hypothetical protein
MHKKLESDLMSLAHSILKMKNKKDVFALKQKSKEIYEKLSMLAFVEEYVNTTPNLKESKEELIEKVLANHLNHLAQTGRSKSNFEEILKKNRK